MSYNCTELVYVAYNSSKILVQKALNISLFLNNKKHLKGPLYSVWLLDLGKGVPEKLVSKFKSISQYRALYILMTDFGVKIILCKNIHANPSCFMIKKTKIGGMGHFKLSNASFQIYHILAGKTVKVLTKIIII